MRRLNIVLLCVTAGQTQAQRKVACAHVAPYESPWQLNDVWTSKKKNVLLLLWFVLTQTRRIYRNHVCGEASVTGNEEKSLNFTESVMLVQTWWS